MKEQTIILQKDSALTRIVSLLSVLVRSGPVEVTVAEYKKTRSKEQNAYLWGCVYPTILHHMPGWDADDLHEYFLGECYGWETLEGFGRKRLRPVRRSSKLKTTEFMDYIAFIQRRMAELGVYIPDPNEQVRQVA